jgi:hypothetical protein
MSIVKFRLAGLSCIIVIVLFISIMYQNSNSDPSDKIIHRIQNGVLNTNNRELPLLMKIKEVAEEKKTNFLIMAYPRYTFFSRCERPASARRAPGKHQARVMLI